MRYLLALLFLLQQFNSVGQNVVWSAPVEVAQYSYGNMHPRIALNGSNDPVVIWGSMHHGGGAHVSYWNGTTFSTPVMLNPTSLPVFTASWAGPDMASYGDTLYAVMKNKPEDTGKIYIARSFDGGQNWSAPMPIGNMGYNRFPTVTTDATRNPIVAWMQSDLNFADPHFQVASSADYGNSFNTPVLASNETAEVCDCCPASLIRSANRVIMQYRNNISNKRTMWARISNNGGSSFDDSVEVDNTNWTVMSCPSSGPDGVVIGDTLYTVFRSSPTTAGARSYLSRSTISNPQLITTDRHAPNFTGLTQQDYPRIAHSGNTIGMVWRQVANGAPKLCFSFTNDVTSGISTDYDTLAKSGVSNGDIAMSPGVVHVVWEDFSSGTVMYRKGLYWPVSIDNKTITGDAINIFPNPANGHFTIAAKDIGDIQSCFLVNTTGQKMQLSSTTENGVYSFSTSGIAKGFYIVSVTGKEGKVFTSKLLIE